MLCKPDSSETYCIQCGWHKPLRIDGWPRRNCPNAPGAPPRAKGSGDYLHGAILKWVGEGPTRECGCKDRITKMNRWGPAGCREHLNEIVEWMMDEAKQRGWWRYAVAVPGSRLFVRRMVLGAIKKAERALSEQPRQRDHDGTGDNREDGAGQ